eukprot:Gregarina_sp_Poly_1__1373@NODE_133_length_13228_cov_89_141783_g119_i0_p6_GENE_NODE_133_length_13228_cov_89_141783_g119_i0NODE_133_length_13228_cov_89_141783_g119_i0_p6_ORF_typecomplete_len150_score22_42Urm1/PF09138_11/5e19ThiS/PF02597_20/0_0057_NODE_133_length_13228_cov_89_141783_g119_i011431592
MLLEMTKMCLELIWTKCRSKIYTPKACAPHPKTPSGKFFGKQNWEMRICVSLFGGLELSIKEKQKTFDIEIDSSGYEVDSVSLFEQIKYTMMIESKWLSLFADEDSLALRPGIVVLVNEVDWEILKNSEGDVKLRDGDTVTLISTLHGG